MTVLAPCARAPRGVMQECSASSTTPTPGARSREARASATLLGQPLLDLRPGGEVLQQPGQLGQPDDALAGQVADMGGRGPAGRIIERGPAEGTCPVLAAGARHVRAWGPGPQPRAPARGFDGRDATPDARP